LLNVGNGISIKGGRRNNQENEGGKMRTKKGITINNKGRILLGLFREEQAKHGHLGCSCRVCIEDMERAYQRFVRGDVE